jgi:hypothetical protein
VNIAYCDQECPIGKEMSRKFLDENNSAYDAALDFMWFTEKCFNTCPYKDKHKEVKN